MIGKTLGHYQITEKLGEGGMGAVYKARDTRLGRLVALKVMRPDRMGDADRKLRFVREAQAASALNHPNILTIYEIDADAGPDYIAMEYIDLKPSNIMLASEGRVKVVDFGLAKLVEASASADETVSDALTASGAVVGTAPHMSPEQAAGRPVDARSDIFSLGTILYEMLAGRRPFGGNTAMSALAAILRDAPAPIPGVAPAVARLVERCLHKDALERFQSAADLKAAIEACLVAQSGPEG